MAEGKTINRCAPLETPKSLFALSLQAPQRLPYLPQVLKNSQMATPLLCPLQNPSKTLKFPIRKNPIFIFRRSFKDIAELRFQPSPLSFSIRISSSPRTSLRSVSSSNLSSIPSRTGNYEVNLLYFSCCCIEFLYFSFLIKVLIIIRYLNLK